MKDFQFTYNGTFYHPSERFKNCVNAMTTNVFKHHFFQKKSLPDSIKLEADKMPKGLKQFYADLFLLTTITKAGFHYRKATNRW